MLDETKAKMIRRPENTLFSFQQCLYPHANRDTQVQRQETGCEHSPPRELNIRGRKWAIDGNRRT